MGKDKRTITPSQRKELRWWIDFMGVNLDRLPGSEVKGLHAEIGLRLGSELSREEELKTIELIGAAEEDLRHALRRIQDNLRYHFESLVDKAKDPDQEKRLRKEFEEEDFIEPGETKYWGYEQCPVVISMKNKIFSKQGFIHTAPVTGDITPESVISHFFSIVNPIPVDLFTQCEKCRRYMLPLRTGKRATRYCSSTCAWNAWAEKKERKPSTRRKKT